MRARPATDLGFVDNRKREFAREFNQVENFFQNEHCPTKLGDQDNPPTKNLADTHGITGIYNTTYLWLDVLRLIPLY